MSDDGAPAFPHEFKFGAGMAERAKGMTLRDYFAATALNTILDQYDFTFFEDDKREKEGDTFALVVARNAYEMADAMLKARNQ